jgi:hypothetical protein
MTPPGDYSDCKTDEDIITKWIRDTAESWVAIVWGLAAKFHFSPETIWKMGLDELWFWYRGMEKITEWQTNSQ